MIIGQITGGGKLECDLPALVNTRLLIGDFGVVSRPILREI